MKLEDIDNIFREQQHQFDKMPSDKLWQRIDSELTPTLEVVQTSRHKVVRWRYYAAAVALLVILPLSWLLITHSPTDSNNKMAMADKKAMTESPIIVETVETKTANNIIEKDMAATTTDITEETVPTIAKPPIQSKEEISVQTPRKKAIATQKPSSPTNKNIDLSSNKTTAFNDAIAPSKANTYPTTSKPKNSNATQTTAPPTSTVIKSGNNQNSQETAPVNDEAIAETNTTTIPIEAESISAASPSSPTANAPIAVSTTSKNTTQLADKSLAQKNAHGYSIGYSRYYANTPLALLDDSKNLSVVQKTVITAADPSTPSSTKAKNRSLLGNEPPLINQYNWLLGHWNDAESPLTFHENWQQINDLSYQASGTAILNGQTVYVENISLNQLGDQLYYQCQNPNNAQYITLRATSKNANKITFETTDSTFLQKVSYTRINDQKILLRLEGINGNVEMFLIR